MARTIRLDAPDTCHHVYSRGNGKQPIFIDDEDCSFFLRRLCLLAQQLDFVIRAYCLMTNHFHLALQRGSIPLPKLMHRLLTAYSRVFNDRWNKVGHAFQGRYGSRLIANDADLMGVIRYIHLNPVSAGLIRDPADWAWSSHRELVQKQDNIIDANWVLSLFGDRAAYEDFLSQPQTKLERVALGELAKRYVEGIRGPSLERATSKARCAFISDALEAGYKRSEVARYLNRSPGAITKLLRRNVNF